MTNGIKTLLSTPVSEMTVGDSFKLNALVLAAMAGVGTAWFGAGLVTEKFEDWKGHREMKKLEASLPMPAPKVD